MSHQLYKTENRRVHEGMKKQEFHALMKENPIFLDGATGSNLQRQGMSAGVCPERWILENREVLIKLQQDFVDAGTNIVYAPTFTANRIKLVGSTDP